MLKINKKNMGSVACALWMIVVAFTAGGLLSDYLHLVGWSWWIIPLIISLIPISLIEFVDD